MKYTIKSFSDLDVSPKALAKDDKKLWEYMNERGDYEKFQRIFDNLAKV